MQLIGVLIKKDSYKKMYNLIGMILIVLAVMDIPISQISLEISEALPGSKAENKPVYVERFTDMVSENIQKDISEKLGFECSIEVVSDLNSMIIKIDTSSDNKNEIKQYVEQKYCTERDEVQIVNEIK